MILDFMNVKNWDEIVAMTKEAVKKAKPGEWILGRGWHQEKWDVTPSPNVDGLPFHHTLSKVSPDNPALFIKNLWTSVDPEKAPTCRQHVLMLLAASLVRSIQGVYQAQRPGSPAT